MNREVDYEYDNSKNDHKGEQQMGKNIKDIAYSVLDLAPIGVGKSVNETFKNSLSLARHVEKLGYKRFWLAEHHSMPGIASSATSVLIGYIAGGTKTIRVGAGGIMLPNHAPLVIAEQFGTLEGLYPGRIDLGLGRAPGSDPHTMYALRRNIHSGEDFPQLLAELRYFFKPTSPTNKVRAIPGEGMDIPIWLLGSSSFSAKLAAELGLPFAFASHFSPEYTLPALNIYHNHFQPSEVLQKPYAMACVNVFAADTTEKAKMLSTSHAQMFLDLIRNTPGKLKPPVESMDGLWTEIEKAAVEKQLSYSFIGNKDEIKEKIESFVAETQIDELMITSSIYDHEERLRSFEIVMEAVQ